MMGSHDMVGICRDSLLKDICSYFQKIKKIYVLPENECSVNGSL